MKYIIESFEDVYYAYTDTYPKMNCHTTQFSTPQEALSSLIEKEIPEFLEFTKDQK